MQVKLDPMTPTPYRVRRSRRESASVATLELETTNGSPPPAFHPGQFNMLYAFGVGEAAISTSGNADEPGRLVHTIRAVGAVSRALTAARPGDILGVRGPFGSSWPVGTADGKDLVIAAGGLGLAPLRPVIYAAIANRARFGKISVLYGARSPEDFLFENEWDRWRKHDITVGIVVDEAKPPWRGKVGHVTALIPEIDFTPSKARAFLCGPEVMMRFTAYELEKRGLSAKEIFVSLERNMKCAIGFCGHCQFREYFVCRDGPVFPFDRVEAMMRVREL
jgi:NAD(P)H-flavin reductase